MPAEYRPEQTNPSLSKAGLKGTQLQLTDPPSALIRKAKELASSLIPTRLLSLSDAEQCSHGVNTLHKRHRENCSVTTKEGSMASISLTVRGDPHHIRHIERQWWLIPLPVCFLCPRVNGPARPGSLASFTKNTEQCRRSHKKKERRWSDKSGGNDLGDKGNRRKACPGLEESGS